MANLRVYPAAKPSASGSAIDVVARMATEAEALEPREAAGRFYPGYATYPPRAAHRQIAVFVVSVAG